ncbi:prolipoprotein diacylglyceryl transferase [Nostocoides sp. F2B08]|uniref:prolipoprotein diacylglyceryl transferase n=1 Tax=Nostocoides sp. F2B08 TaxID=2653936 RepID=UPI00186B2122|nr:prolipoprotein diacylglyceryl transferase [Tetrasphaera sp. F2B08]
MLLAIPSPTVSAFQVGPLTIHAYALCILTGIFVAIWLTQRRLEARGGEPGQVLDIATYAVPAGIIGGRIYHVISSPQPYFGEGGNPVDALKIWEGGLGIWGAIAFGALGAWYGTRRVGIPFLTFADAAAPGVALAQAIGRFGNWFNNELYGGPTDLPWGLTIHEWDQSAGRAVRDASGEPVVLGTFHPVFLYEAIWLVLLAAALMLAERRFTLARGQVLGLYVAGYPVGRIVLELMRTDDATIILGQRINVWTSLVVFLVGITIVVWAGRTQPRDVSQSETAPLG